VTWAEQPEAAPIECRQLWLAKTLDDCQDSGVDEANIGVGALIADLAYPPVVFQTEILHTVGAGIDVVQQRDQDSRMQTSVNPVVHLDEHGRRNGD